MEQLSLFDFEYSLEALLEEVIKEKGTSQKSHCTFILIVLQKIKRNIQVYLYLRTRVSCCKRRY